MIDFYTVCVKNKISSRMLLLSFSCKLFSMMRAVIGTKAFIKKSNKLTIFCFQLIANRIYGFDALYFIIAKDPF